MLNSGPWKWIVLILIILSISGKSVSDMKEVILSYNFLVGISNDFYSHDDKMAKVAYMKYCSYAAIVAPILAGIIIDKTRRIWIGLVLFAIISTLAMIIFPVEDRTLSTILT